MSDSSDSSYPLVWKARHPRKDPVDWTVAELAYMAGLMDGEGNFTIAINPRTATLKNRIGVAITDQNVTIWLCEHFGGSRETVIWKAGAARPVDCLGFRWNAYGQVAVDITKAILPYLVIKPDEAAIFVEAWEKRNPQWGGGRGHHKPMTPEIRALRESYRDKLKALRADRKAKLQMIHPRSRASILEQFSNGIDDESITVT